MSAGEVLTALAGLGVLALFLVPLIMVRQVVRRRRDERLAQQWEWALQQASHADCQLARVVRVYQYARNGSKAIITRPDRGAQQDTWFADWHAPVGVYVLIRGSTGYGPHNSNPNVFYVSQGGVVGVVPGEAPRAWERNRKRRAKTRRAKSSAG